MIFAYQSQIRAGDFDVRTRVGIRSVWPTAYSEVGWMARADTTPGSMFAGVLAGPSLGSCDFNPVPPREPPAASAGSMPVITRALVAPAARGITFTGYGSFDGQTWLRLGSATLAMPVQVYLGFAVSSHNPAATIQTSGATCPTSRRHRCLQPPPAFEPLGPSSRRTGLTFSEIMYHPADGTNTFPRICRALQRPGLLRWT
jgi:hypothetical protein